MDKTKIRFHQDPNNNLVFCNVDNFKEQYSLEEITNNRCKAGDFECKICQQGRLIFYIRDKKTSERFIESHREYYAIYPDDETSKSIDRTTETDLDILLIALEERAKRNK